MACVCEFVVCTYQVIYFIGCSYVRILVVVEKAFLCFRSVCPSVRPSIRPFVCHLVSRQPNQRQLLKCIIFSSFFASAFSFVYAHLLFFLPVCAFFGVYIWTLLPLRVEKISKQYPTTITRTKIKKSSALSSPFSQWRRPPNNELCCVVCSLVSLFVRSFVVHMYMRLVVNMFDCLCCSCCCCCVMLLVTVVSKALT